MSDRLADFIDFLLERTSRPGVPVLVLGMLVYGAGELCQFNLWGPRWWRHHGSDFGFPGYWGFLFALSKWPADQALASGYVTFLLLEFLTIGQLNTVRFDWLDILAASLYTLLAALVIRRYSPRSGGCPIPPAVPAAPRGPWRA